MATVKLAFDHRHYVPVIRQKHGEMLALRDLRPEDKQYMTPIIELPPSLIDMKDRKKLTNASFFIEITKQIAGTWGQAPLFVDVELLYAVFGSPRGQHPLWSFSEAARTLRMPIIPVTGLSRSRDYQVAVEKVVATDRYGVCLRLSEDDLYNTSLEKEIRQLITKLKVHPKQVDLLVDFKLISAEWMEFEELCKRVPLLSSWRTFTVVSGAFPKNLSELEKNRQHELSRDDWLHWLDQIKNGSTLARRPAFGDYTIQHPFYSTPPKRANVSASIRYAADKYWVIMRGEGLRNKKGPGFAQYWANAQLLASRPEFKGADFSKGDDYIYKKSQPTNNPGSPTTWISAGINHHLTLVVRQIASLFESSNGDGPGNGSGQGPRPRQASRKSSREASSAHLQPYQLPLIK